MKRGRQCLALTVVLLCAAQVAAGDEPLLYVADARGITFTNTPRPAARPVPGLATPSGGQTGPLRRLPTTTYDPYIERVARESGLSPALIKAVTLVESGGDAAAVSRAGAQGLMQLMPQTAAAYGVNDAFDPLANLRGGATHLRRLLERYDGDLTLALAAYNAGEGAVQRHNGVPDYAETVDYIRQVHEKLGRRPRGLPAERSQGAAERPIRVRVLGDGSVLFSN